MAEITTLARPYAKAAYEFALENKALETWSSMLGFVSSLVQDPYMQKVLQSPVLSDQQKAETLTSIDPSKIDPSGRNFICQLARHDRLELLPEIFILFEVLKAEQEKRVDVKVLSAFPLSAAENEKLTASLKKRLGRDVQINSEVDKSLIGGLVIRAGDLVIDGSVSGKLAKLSERLNK